LFSGRDRMERVGRAGLNRYRRGAKNVLEPQGSYRNSTIFFFVSRRESSMAILWSDLSGLLLVLGGQG